MSKVNQGKNKRYGRKKIPCAKYYNEGRLGKNKLVRFLKNNVGKDWSEEKKAKVISWFKDLHRSKHSAHTLAK